jgi:hypothetical protein
LRSGRTDAIDTTTAPGVGFDDTGRSVEVLVALTRATLAIVASLTDEEHQGRR